MILLHIIIIFLLFVDIPVALEVLAPSATIVFLSESKISRLLLW